MTDSPDHAIFSLLPQPEGRRRSFVTSSIVNLTFLGLILLAGMWAPKVIEHHYEETQMIAPTLPPPMKIRRPRPQPPKHMLEPRPVPPKPVRMEARLTAPPMPHIRPNIALTPRPRPALAAAMPAQNKFVHPAMTPVHLGDIFGVTPNPNAVRPAHRRRSRQSLWRLAGSCSSLLMASLDPPASATPRAPEKVVVAEEDMVAELHP